MPYYEHTAVLRKAETQPLATRDTHPGYQSNNLNQMVDPRCGIGLGLASAQLAGAVLASAPVEISDHGSATQSTVRQIGSALGTAVSGAVLSAALAITLPAQLADHGIPDSQATQLAEATAQSAGTTITQLRIRGDSASTIDALSAGFAQATQLAMLVAAGFLLLGVLGAWQLRRLQQVDRAAAR